MDNLTNDDNQLLLNVFTNQRSNPLDNTMINLDVNYSTLSQKDLLNLSGNNNLNENSLIFSCFDYKNTIGNFNKELSGYPYRQNNLFFINNDQYIFPLNYNILNKESHFSLDNRNRINVKISNNFLSYDKDKKVITPNLDNIKKTNSTENGLFKINTENLFIDNGYLNIIYDYNYIISNKDIKTKFDNLIEETSNKLNKIKKLNPKISYDSNIAVNKNVEIDYIKNLIYEDKKNKIEINNFVNYYNVDDEGKYYHYFPQYYIDKDIDNFNIIIPFTFNYKSICALPNYINFINIDNIIKNVKVYKVSENIEGTITRYTNPLDVNVMITAHKYFHDVNAFIEKETIHEYNNFYSLIYLKNEDNNILRFNKDKSYLLDYKISNVEYVGGMNIFYGKFDLVLNFSVNHKSDFDLCEIIINYFEQNDSNIIEKKLPIMLRFCNDKSNEVNINDSIYYDKHIGFNYDGYGKLIGKCCIPENFFNKNNTSNSVLKFYKKPVFISSNKYQVKYKENFEIPFYGDNAKLSNLKCNNNDYNNYSNILLNLDRDEIELDRDEIEKIALKFYYINRLNRYKSGSDKFNEYIFGKVQHLNFNKSCHYIKNIFKELQDNLNYIEVENINSSIYDYELYKLKEENYNIGTNIYFKDISGNSDFSSKYQKYFNSKQILNTSSCFPEIDEIYGDGLSKGDYYLPNLFEYYVIKKINKNEDYFILTTSYTYDDNMDKYNIIGGQLNNEILEDLSHEITKDEADNLYKLPESYAIFKIPDYSLLVSDNYYMYFDEENNYYIIDYFGDYINGGYLSFNIKKNYSFENVENDLEIKDNNFNTINDNKIDIKANNIINIKTNLQEFFICYKDSDPDMNIINNEYRILCKVFIKK